MDIQAPDNGMLLVAMSVESKDYGRTFPDMLSVWTVTLDVSWYMTILLFKQKSATVNIVTVLFFFAL